MKTAVSENEFLILGGGLCGLAAGYLLGEYAAVVEREARAGGLVRSECNHGYWFDHVLHLLYFPDEKTEARITALLGDDLSRIEPHSWVETAHGTVRFPFQMHLGGLDSDTVIRCLRDLAQETFAPAASAPENFEEMLLRTFGRGMCDAFLFPYNRKMWKRPLDELAPSGFQWNIARPEFEQVVTGAINPDAEYRAYNARGWYPRPPADSPLRGMEVLSAALAARLPGLRTEHTVEAIDLDAHSVTARGPGGPVEFRYRRECLSTLPLPVLVSMCRQAPESLREKAASLARNRVVTVALSIEGPRPQGRGNWRYYSDEDLVFTRLIYLHEFDPDIAPPEGWVLMAEITERAEDPATEREALIARVRRDVEAAGALPPRCRIVDEHMLVIDPAYVVFTPENFAVMEELRGFLSAHHVTPLGRYGRWEYSSMAQVMRDGFSWAEDALARHALAPYSENVADA